MTNIKDLIKTLDFDDDIDTDDSSIEVYADSVKQALELASYELKIDISLLDYEIIEKGTSGFWGAGRKPYKLLVRPQQIVDKYKDILDIEKKLSSATVTDDSELAHKVSFADGKAKIRVTKSGIWLTVTPPIGKGRKIVMQDITNQLLTLKITNADIKKVEKAVKTQSNKPVKIGEWMPNPQYDGTMSVEISEDEMKAIVYFDIPKFSGRHMEVDDVLEIIRNAGAVVGADEERISQYLEKMDYREPLVAAEGTRPKHGKDAYIDYKVRIDKTKAVFEEDEKGQVDFKNLDLLENVVVGQLLAVKMPPEEGVPGRTVTNRVLPAKSGKDIILKYGKGTILSEDGKELTAEINGQVIYQAGKISVDPIHLIKGDVSLETGNIVFLGSVIVSGNVQDNFTVKAAGNIEIKGTVQKAYLEAEGNIIVRQGIIGREGAKIESTGGSVYAKFIQSANIIAEKDVIVPEGILHSSVDAGTRIISYGRRGKIAGGIVRAGEEINARSLGSDTFIKTDLFVGVNPKMLQQISSLNSTTKNIHEELDKLKLDLNTLSLHKKNAGGTLPPDKEELYGKMLIQKQKLTGRLNEINLELDELKAYMGMMQQKGRICAEKTIYPGVEIHIKDQNFSIKDEYTNIKFTLEKEGIRLSEYEPPIFDQEQAKMMHITGRRR